MILVGLATPSYPEPAGEPVTRPALAATSACEVEVFTSKFMASDAMRLGASRCSLDVLDESDWLQMARLDAASVSAEVVEDQSIWDRSDERHVGLSMRQSSHLAVVSVNPDEDDPVAVLVGFPAPFQASVIGSNRVLQKSVSDWMSSSLKEAPRHA